MRWLRSIVVLALFVTPVFGDEEVPDLYEPVVPPGQEELLADMLGRGVALPGDCRLGSGGADGCVITATYKCAGGDVVLEILHPTNAPDAPVQTEAFALAAASGSPPVGLIDAVAKLMHSRESEFEWLWFDDGDEEEAGADAAE